MFKWLRQTISAYVTFEKQMTQLRCLVPSDHDFKNYKIALMECATMMAAAGYTPKEVISTMKAIARTGLVSK